MLSEVENKPYGRQCKSSRDTFETHIISKFVNTVYLYVCIVNLCNFRDVSFTLGSQYVSSN